MSKTTHRDTAPRTGESVEQRLARLLDTPFLARIVPHLAPETIQQLIEYRGLDACGELVTSATPAQLTSVLDLDLWRHTPGRPGSDERFDADRFGEWLEVLVDTGESVAARTVAALEKPLVIAGLSRYLRVIDPGTFEPHESSDDEATDRHEKMNSEPGGNVVECEVGGYLLRARKADAWDAIVTLLGALETDHPHYFHAVMQECRRLSNSRPEIDGLDDLLMAPEQHIYDVAIDREGRRSQHGYATAADARAFLQMARRPRTPLAPDAPRAMNPIAAAYFRAAEESEENAAAPEAPAPGDVEDLPADVSTSIQEVMELLAEAGVTPPERPRALLAAADDPRTARLPVLTRLMEFVLDANQNAYQLRSGELAFLANTLLAGCSVQSRPFTPQEAADAAASVCNLGLERLPVAWRPEGFLVDHNLVSVFETGWSVLYEDVSLFVADQLLSMLADLRCGDADTQSGLRALQRALAKQREAGAPWLSRDAADVLMPLDATAWISVLGLLDECPIVPEALTAILEHRTTAVSPTAFEFISTTAQIGDIRLFMRMLPGVLSR